MVGHNYAPEENVQSVKDASKDRPPIFYNEQIDQSILEPDAKSNVITKKRPRIIKVPIFLLDENGGKVPITDDKGKIVINKQGEMQYIIKDYESVQDGWESVLDVIPASEIFTVDNATSNISGDAVKLLTRIYWNYNYLSVYQQMTENDYSIYLHKLRNDAVSILQSAKSYNGGTVQAIKTFINKTDSTQWTKTDEPQKKADPFGWLTGGNKKELSEKQKAERNNKFTGFQ